jgi:16S rRNA (uracil1498-N3)-methyltransferase
MPNKFDKIELIVQKCVEIGIASIHFFVAQYSQIRDISPKKIERLEKIALEATEQSYGVLLPTCTFVPTLESLCLL